jgi:hypothetical protein
MSGKKRKLEIRKKRKKKLKAKKNTMFFFAKSKHKQVSASSEFGLCDDPPPAKEPAYINETDKTKWIAIISNSRSQEITFTAIDNCPEYDFRKENGEKDKRCDGVITIAVRLMSSNITNKAR